MNERKRQNSESAMATSNKFPKLDSEPIKVCVGNPATAFWVHEDAVCDRSLFFRKCMKGEWKEKNEHLIEFPEDDPKVFSMYLQIVYSGQPKWETADHSERYSLLAKAYLFGDKVQDATFKNSVMDQFTYTKRECQFLPNFCDVRIIYEGTMAGSCARKWLADTYAWHTSADWLREQAPDQCPVDFWFDLAVALKDKGCMVRKDPIQYNTHKYHEDEAGARETT